MKNNCIFSLIICLCFALPACKQEIKNCQLGKSYSTTGYSTVVPNMYLYNSDGKLIRISYTNGNIDTLQYAADTLSISSFDNQALLLRTLSGIVAPDDYFTSAIKTTYAGNGTVSSTENLNLEHNAEGRLTKCITASATGTTVLSLNYFEGNSTTGVEYRGTTLAAKYIFYHSHIENKTGIDDLYGTFAPYWGHPSKNLLDSVHRIVFPAADTVRTQYTHTLDANGYVSKTIETRLSGGATTLYHTYQYFNCR